MRRLAGALFCTAVLLAACGDDDDGDGTTTTTTEQPAPETTATTAAPEPTTTTEAAAPAGDPLDAAAAFLDVVFPGHGATLGAFQQGDNRSGEVPVFRPREGGGEGPQASTLFLRLGEDDEWNVIGAASPTVAIASPENGATVPTVFGVSGVGRGFEATLVVRALDPTDGEIAQAVAMGGAQAEPLPYEATLDLGDTPSGTEVLVVVSGGTGLETDTGEFSAVFVVVE